MSDQERMFLANLEALTDTEVNIPFICIGEIVFCAIEDGQRLDGVKMTF